MPSKEKCVYLLYVCMAVYVQIIQSVLPPSLPSSLPPFLPPSLPKRKMQDAVHIDRSSMMFSFSSGAKISFKASAVIS